MSNWIRIGTTIGSTPNDQSNNSISINATPEYIAPGENSCIIKPIRDASNEAVSSLLGYNSATGEVVRDSGALNELTPRGMIIPYSIFQDLSGDAVIEPITGWLWCNGAIGLNDIKYQDLSGALGTTYGSQGQLPDLRGRTIFGDLAGATVDVSRSSLATGPGSVVGDDKFSATVLPVHTHTTSTHTHTLPNHDHDMPAHHHDMTHTHTVPFYDGTDDGGPGFGNADSDGGAYAIGAPSPDNSGAASTTTTGSSEYTVSPNADANTNATGLGESYIPPTIVMNFLIKY